MILRIVLIFMLASICHASTSQEELWKFDKAWRIKLEEKRNPKKPLSLKQSENAFIAFCNESFEDNNNQKRSVSEFTVLAEYIKAKAQTVLTTNATAGLLMMLEASELIHKATGYILEVKNEAARWGSCPYDTNASWDHIQWHEELDE